MLVDWTMLRPWCWRRQPLVLAPALARGWGYVVAIMEALGDLDIEVVATLDKAIVMGFIGEGRRQPATSPVAAPVSSSTPSDLVRQVGGSPRACAPGDASILVFARGTDSTRALQQSK